MSAPELEVRVLLCIRVAFPEPVPAWAMHPRCEVTDDVRNVPHLHSIVMQARSRSAKAKVAWTCKPGDAIAAAERSLEGAQVGRRPVVDESGQLVGVLSLADIARAAGKARKRTRPEIKEAVPLSRRSPRPS